MDTKCIMQKRVWETLNEETRGFQRNSRPRWIAGDEWKS